MAIEHVRVRAFLLSQRPERASSATSDWEEAEAVEAKLDGEALAALKINKPQLAAYGVNQFYIRLSSFASLLDEDGVPRSELDDETRAIFAHEYAHFVQNTSTVSGWNSFFRHASLLQLFSQALNDQAFCEPQRLTSDQQFDVSSMLWDGEEVVGATTRLNTSAEVRVLGVHESVSERTSRRCVDVEWGFERDGETVATRQCRVGTYLIEEGVAYLLESSARTGRAVFHEGADPGPEPIPQYPYVAFQRLCRHVAGELSASAAIVVGCLALNAHRPAWALLRLCEMYRSARVSGASDEDACGALERHVAATVPEVLKRLQDDEIPILEPMFLGRGQLEDGAAQVFAWFRSALSRRALDPVFDVRWALGPNFDANALYRLMAIVPPCDVVQEREWVSGGRPADLVLSTSRLSEDARVGLRGMQAQLHFMHSHLGSSGFVPTGDADIHRCPMIWQCADRIRVDLATCARHPWAHWQKQPRCVYGLGVAGAISELVPID